MTEQNRFSKERSLAAKGFAICAMLFHHCFFKNTIYQGYLLNFWPFPESLITNIALFGKLCVGTFAFVSGYGLSLKWREYRSEKSQKFFSSRYISTMSGYWFAFAVCCIFYQIMDGRTQATYWNGTILENCSEFLMSFLGVSRLVGTPMLIYEWWYMSAAILFILIVPVFYEAIDRVGSIAVITFTALLPRILGVAFLGGTHPLSFLMAALLGVIFEKRHLFDCIHNRLESHHWLGATCKALLTLAGMLLAYKLYRRLSFEQYWEIKYAVVPVLMIMCLNESIFNVSIFQKVLVFFGKHSMNMYLVHMVFLNYFKEFLFNNRHFLFSWCLLMLLSLCSSLIFEQIKSWIHWDRMIFRICTKLN